MRVINRNNTLVIVALAIAVLIAALIFMTGEQADDESASSSTTALADDGPSTSADNTAGAQSHTIQPDQSVSAPPNRQELTSADATEEFEPQNFSELLERYTPNERKRITQFSDDHFGALEFSTPEQHEWLSLHGYPEAEDILSAEFLTLDELKEKADAGDRTAMALASERALNLMIEEGLKWRELGEDPLLADQKFFEYSLLAQQYSKKLLRAGSPFGAYLEARWAFESSLLSGSRPSDDAEIASIATGAVSSLYLAELMGDDRIDRFARRFAYSTGISHDRLSAIRLTIGAVKATESGIGCETLFGNEPIPQ